MIIDLFLSDVYRWRPAGPLGMYLVGAFFQHAHWTASRLAIPHRVDKADVYDGYYIPAHSIVIANVW